MWRRAAWTAVLCFPIIGRSGIAAEIPCSNALMPEPAKSGFMSILHEIKIDELAVNPQIHFIPCDPIYRFAAYFKFKLCRGHLVRYFRVRLDDVVRKERLGELVNWGFRQTVAYRVANLNFDWESLSPSEIRKNDISNPIALRGLTATKTERARIDTDYRQLNGYSCSGA